MIDTILFDWDGTLIDTATPAFNAFRKSLGDLGIMLEVPLYERIYSPNWRNMYEDLQLPKERWDEADGLWLKHYALESCTLMPGAAGALRELASREYVVGLVTSGTRGRVLREIDTFGLRDAFRVIVCADDVVKGKPDPEGLRIAMDRLNVGALSCCYVGDSAEDIEMGRRAGVVTVRVKSRYPVNKALEAARPDFYWETLEEFVQMWRKAVTIDD